MSPLYRELNSSKRAYQILCTHALQIINKSDNEHAHFLEEKQDVLRPEIEKHLYTVIIHGFSEGLT